MKYQAVIFDLDGTLLNTLEDLAGSVNHALGEFGFPKRTVTEIRSFIGNGVVRLMERAVPAGIDGKTFEKCFSAFREHYLEHMYDTTKPYDGILELLDELKARGVKTSVVSNKLHAGVVGLCGDFFADRLTSAFGVGDESERKPAPLNVLRALDSLKTEKCAAVYVGDSEVDVQTAKNAGLACIGVTWGYRDRSVLLKSGADFIVKTPEEILKYVK